MLIGVLNLTLRVDFALRRLRPSRRSTPRSTASWTPTRPWTASAAPWPCSSSCPTAPPRPENGPKPWKTLGTSREKGRKRAENGRFSKGFRPRSPEEIVFSARPWGIDFTKSVPMTVKRVRANSHASLVGVQARRR